MHTKPGIDNETGRSGGYQFFTLTTYHFTNIITYHYLGQRKKRKDLKYDIRRYDEVFRDGYYIIAEHHDLKGRFVETLDGENWRHVPPWRGTFEVPKCICMKQLER